MHWSAGRNAGFSEAEPWLPVDPSYVERNVEREDADPSSLLNWYRRLIRLRREKAALRAGSYRTVGGVPRGVYAYLRELKGEKVAVLLNFNPRAAALDTRTWGKMGGTLPVLLSSHRGEGLEMRAGRIELAPHEALLLEM